MNATDDKPTNEQRSSGIGPGERLQAARIQQGLSLDDVARRMHLSSRILAAIEDNDFEEITAPIFVKGYLRAYARIVSLDEDGMIDQYVDFYSDEDPPISSTSSNLSSELSVADARIKWTTYVVVLVVAGLLALWWWNKEKESDAVISLDSQSSTVEEPAAAATEVVGSDIEAVSENVIESGETVEASSSPTASAVNPEAESTSSPTTQEPAVEEVEVVEVEVEEVEVVTEEVAADEVISDEAVTSEVVIDEAVTDGAVVVQSGSLETAQVTRNEPTLLAPVGSDKLKVVVHADTWADIKDTNSHQLVYDLLRADEAVEMTGEAPFSVFLGNGHGVEIMFNGEQIDVAPRIRDDNTARLKIGG